MPRPQRNVPKSVMHVQRCCFSQKILFLRWPPLVAVFVVALTLLGQVLIIYPSLPGLSVKRIYQTWSAAIVFYYTGTYLCWLLSLFSRTTLPKFYINFALMMGVVRATWYLQIFFYQPLYWLVEYSFITDNRSYQYVNSPYFPCDKFSPLFSWILLTTICLLILAVFGK